MSVQVKKRKIAKFRGNLRINICLELELELQLLLLLEKEISLGLAFTTLEQLEFLQLVELVLEVILLILLVEEMFILPGLEIVALESRTLSALRINNCFCILPII